MSCVTDNSNHKTFSSCLETLGSNAQLVTAAQSDGTTTITEVTKDKCTQVFTIPDATDGSYGTISFVARIWIEGESTSCWDATANQDWDIDFYFSATEPTDEDQGGD